jgi:hypothetical protein
LETQFQKVFAIDRSQEKRPSQNSDSQISEKVSVESGIEKNQSFHLGVFGTRKSLAQNERLK